MGDYSETESKLDDCCFIPVGFRCYTQDKLRNNNLKAETLTFDFGFFPPQSIVSVLKSGNMNLLLDDRKEPMNFSFCKKIRGLKSFSFQEISESEIDKQLEGGYDNKLLDTSCGYYTLNKEHNFVLAHYLYHNSSKRYKTNYRNIIDIRYVSKKTKPIK